MEPASPNGYPNHRGKTTGITLSGSLSILGLVIAGFACYEAKRSADLAEKVAKKQAEQAAWEKLPRLSAVPRKPWFSDGGFTAVSVRNDSLVTPAPIVAVTFRVHLPEMRARIESRIPRRKGPHQAIAPEMHRPFVFGRGYW